ncbi:MAG TPA: hypothetical protein VF247_12450 [Candidatus Krumholzibacteria bacterium]
MQINAPSGDSSHIVESRGSRLPDIAFFSALAVIFGVLLYNLRAGNIDLVQRYTGDDAYFYLVIARNFADGIFSSFDGIHFTNGYHPLWMVPLALIGTVFRDRDAFLLASILLGILLDAAALWLLWSFALRHFEDRSVAYLVLGGAVFFLVLPSWYCLEAPLAVLMMLLGVVYCMRHFDDMRPRSNLVLGLLLGCVVLARLDSIFYVGPIFLVRLVSQRGKGAPAAHALSIGVFVAVVSAYVAFNLVMTGHMVPISGAIKSSFPVPTLTNIPLSPGRLARTIPPVLAAVVVVLVLRTGRASAPVTKPVAGMFAGMNVGVIGFGIYEFLFQKDAAWGLRPWHFAVPNLIALISTGMFVLPLVPRRARYALAVVVLGVCVAGGVGKYGRRQIRDIPSYDIYHTATWIRENVPDGDVIAATDPGSIAYFGGHKTVNLDGLVNSFEYQEIVAAGKLQEYLDENRVRYIAIMGRGPSRTGEVTRVPVRARLYSAADTLSVRNADVVYRSPHNVYTIWKQP